MAKFQIKYALGGGFGGIANKDWETIEAKDLSDAENQAYDLACLEYESYEGSNGLRTLTDIMEDEGGWRR